MTTVSIIGRSAYGGGNGSVMDHRMVKTDCLILD